MKKHWLGVKFFPLRPAYGGRKPHKPRLLRTYGSAHKPHKGSPSLSSSYLILVQTQVRARVVGIIRVTKRWPRSGIWMWKKTQMQKGSRRGFEEMGSRDEYKKEWGNWKNCRICLLIYSIGTLWYMYRPFVGVYGDYLEARCGRVWGTSQSVLFF